MVYRLLADLVLIAHVSFVAFVVVGLVLILIGGARGWRWVHDRRFRIVHLAAIGLVVVQAWLDVACPLTTLENTLRRMAGQTGYDEGFIAHWLHRVLFFDLDPWVFVTAYTFFGLLVLLTFWLVPVHWRKK